MTALCRAAFRFRFSGFTANADASINDNPYGTRLGSKR
jgi:hypothetical protein